MDIKFSYFLIAFICINIIAFNLSKGNSLRLIVFPFDALIFKSGDSWCIISEITTLKPLNTDKTNIIAKVATLMQMIEIHVTILMRL